MARDTTIQRVEARRLAATRIGHAEVFTIGPRKAVMEFLEARSTVRRERNLLGSKSSARQRRESAA